MKFVNSFKRTILKHRRIVIGLLFFWVWTFGLGMIGGWFLAKGGLDKFPDLTERDKVLIVAPHIDDETISGAGLILEALKKKAKIKIIYMTNGDDSLAGVIKEDKNLSFNPEEFIQLGEQRMEEGRKAMVVLGLKDKDFVFLGYPDRGLRPMLSRFYYEDRPLFASGTRFNHNPYQNTLKPGRIYAGENVVSDLKEIMDEFKPTIILVSHPRDAHPDHQASFHFLKKALAEEKKNIKLFTYLVHYSLYPPKKKLLMNNFLYPPKKLFTSKGWVSLELSWEEENKKLKAMDQYQSQLNSFYDFLRAFVRRNEIFEEME